ncbi:uncharacterized protein LOC121875905 [Homarus americanus]|uniref:uncharacterized protein LOC121875905 n=1 Tax=Homarus americanus TaxID=6706 RepID=UPI001C441D5B|nr:uncharacterized protein LOC121875905 [Homarus americanus]
MSSMEASQPDNSSRDWCAIWSTIVVSVAIVFIGMSFLVRSSATVGLVLLFSGGGLMVLAVCALVGKCKINTNKDPLPDYDRPPSYRVSWRRSFLRRIRERNSPESDLTEVSHTTSQIDPRNTTQDHASSTPHPVPVHIQTVVTSVPPIQASVNTLTEFGNSLYYDPSSRHAQSLSNIADPPPYEVALAGMDEGTLRKLKSENCLPLAPLD